MDDFLEAIKAVVGEGKPQPKEQPQPQELTAEEIKQQCQEIAKSLVG